MIDNRKKCIFIHVSKTGGTSIEHALNPHVPLDTSSGASQKGNTRFRDKHWSAKQYKFNYPQKYESYFTFAFVRNPWDRFVSNWNWFEYLNMYTDETFESWLTKVVGTEIYSYERMLREHGETIVDFVGEFENLQSDFNHVCQVLGISPTVLPHKNNLSKRPHYSRYYSKKTKQLVSEHFTWVIKRFGYEFERPV